MRGTLRARRWAQERFAWLAALAVLGLPLAPAVALAGTLEVAPVTHELPASRHALSLSVVNRGAAAATLQVRAFAWSQHDGEERLTPAPEVILSPAIFGLEPGRTQTVRALFPADTVPHERSYRLLVDEIPEPGHGEPVRFALRLSIPVFRLAATPAPAALAWQLQAGSARLVASNGGGRRERLRDLVLTSADGRSTRPASPSGLYLLSGQQRSWSVDAATAALRPGETWTLTGMTDAGPLEVALVVSP